MRSVPKSAKNVLLFSSYILTYMHACIRTLHYITLHYIALHYITLHYITLQHTTLHLHLHYITLHYLTLHYITHTYIHTYIHTNLRAYAFSGKQSYWTSPFIVDLSIQNCNCPCFFRFTRWYMRVSINGGTPKSFSLDFPNKNHPAIGVPPWLRKPPNMY